MAMTSRISFSRIKLASALTLQAPKGMPRTAALWFSLTLHMYLYQMARSISSGTTVRMPAPSNSSFTACTLWDTVSLCFSPISIRAAFGLKEAHPSFMTTLTFAREYSRLSHPNTAATFSSASTPFNGAMIRVSGPIWFLMSSKAWDRAGNLVMIIAKSG